MLGSLEDLLDYLTEPRSTAGRISRNQTKQNKISSRLPPLPYDVMREYMSYHEPSGRFVDVGEKDRRKESDSLEGIVVYDRSYYDKFIMACRTRISDIYNEQEYPQISYIDSADDEDRLRPFCMLLLNREGQYQDFVRRAAASFKYSARSLPFVREAAAQRNAYNPLSDSNILQGNLPPDVVVNLFFTFLNEIVKHRDEESFLNSRIIFSPESRIRDFDREVWEDAKFPFPTPTASFLLVHRPEWKLFEIHAISRNP